MMRGPRRRSEAGSASPLGLMLGLALIVLPTLVVVLSLPAWEGRVVDAQDAARVAVRALSEAPNWETGVAAAEAAIGAVASGDGLDGHDISESFSGDLQPGGDVTASVSVAVPATRLPGLGLVAPLHYTAVSTAHVDDYEESPS
jgi:hypothetical protein